MNTSFAKAVQTYSIRQAYVSVQVIRSVAQDYQFFSSQTGEIQLMSI